MAHADNISSDYVKSISSQVKQLIVDSLDEKLFPVIQAQLNPGVSKPIITVGDSLQIWTIDKKGLEEFGRSEAPLNKVARRTGQWQHLVKVNGEGVAFARSFRKGDRPSLCQLQTSPVAGRIAEAIEFIERETTSDSALQQKLGKDPLVRLLSVPTYRVYALWLINEASNESYVLVVDSPFKSLKFKDSDLLASEKFLQGFQERKLVFGIS